MKTKTTNTKESPALNARQHLVFFMLVIFQINFISASDGKLVSDNHQLKDNYSISVENSEKSPKDNSNSHVETITIIGNASLINHDKKTDFNISRLSNSQHRKQNNHSEIIHKNQNGKTIALKVLSKPFNIRVNNKGELSLLLLQNINYFIPNYNKNLKIWNSISNFNINNTQLYAALLFIFLTIFIISLRIRIFRNRPPPLFV
jgi:hypothetical protein